MTNVIVGVMYNGISGPEFFVSKNTFLTHAHTHENAYFAHGNRLCVPLNERAFVLVDIAAGDSDR